MLKRIGKICIIAVVCLLVLAVLLVTAFPKVFWAVHNRNSERIQRAPRLEGQSDLEAAYGEDAHTAVAELHLPQTGRAAEEYVLFYPAEPEHSDKTYPVIVWGNGTANTYENYRAALVSLASYGFVVAGCRDSHMGGGETLYRMALDVKDLNTQKDSPLYGKLDTAHIGAAGHSQGACGAVNAATKFAQSKTLFTSLFTTSLPKLAMCADRKNMEFAYWKYDPSRISVPYFATSGTRFLDSLWIAPLASMEENFAALPSGIPAYLARQKGANHNIVGEYHGCGYLNAWFCYTLKDDQTAAQVFTGDAELARNTTRWTDFETK